MHDALFSVTSMALSLAALLRSTPARPCKSSAIARASAIGVFLVIAVVSGLLALGALLLVEVPTS